MLKMFRMLDKRDIHESLPKIACHHPNYKQYSKVIMFCFVNKARVLCDIVESLCTFLFFVLNINIHMQLFVSTISNEINYLVQVSFRVYGLSVCNHNHGLGFVSMSKFFLFCIITFNQQLTADNQLSVQYNKIAREVGRFRL